MSIYNTGPHILPDAAAVEALPDGTIIAWLRIPGDPTSEAVAFVRHEVELSVATNAQQRVTRITWISPGGWDPQTIKSAGVTFPCRVIKWGGARIPTVPEPEMVAASIPSLDPIDLRVGTFGALTGGTWARETALKAAAQVHQGEAYSYDATAENILALAERFEEWLDRDTEDYRP